MDPLTIGMTALSFGGKLLSGMGQSQASAKQGRLQMIADAMAREKNEAMLREVNQRREALGRELLTVEESHTVEGGSGTDNYSYFDVDGFQDAAARAGINPITFLNAGGLSAYTQTGARSWTSQTTTSRGHNAAEAFKMMLPEYALAQASQVPQQHSALTAFGDALSAGGSTFGTQHRANQSYDLNMQKLLMAQELQGMGLGQQNGMTVARVGSGGFADAAKAVGGLSSTFKASKDGDAYWPAYELPPSQLWEVKKPETTNPLPPSMGWSIPPGYANAEAYEDAFGEVISWPYGVLKFANTILYNTTGNTLEGGLKSYFYDGKKWDGSERPPGGPLSPYVPAGMSPSIAYPSWAKP